MLWESAGGDLTIHLTRVDAVYGRTGAGEVMLGNPTTVVAGERVTHLVYSG